MGDWFEWAGLQRKEYSNGTMTRYQPTASHGGSAQAVQVRATQNTHTDLAQRRDTLISPSSMEAVALTAYSARTGITET